jgi:hypothetical protein
LIFLRVAREEYRHRLRHWLYRCHIPDSISQFEPYVSKYAYYPAFPPPPGSEAFGAHNLALTEHYWNFPDPNLPHGGEPGKTKTLAEYFPPDVLRWQGNIPDIDPSDTEENLNADTARRTNAFIEENVSPFVFAFVPPWWEKDLKGAGRTVEDGPNYRWLFLVKYPDGVSEEEGDAWLVDRALPAFADCPETTRILTSKVRQDVNGCAFSRCVEIWFDGPDEWEAAVARAATQIEKPVWASKDAFPYLKRFAEIVSLFLGDIAECNNLMQYRGYITMR